MSKYNSENPDFRLLTEQQKKENRYTRENINEANTNYFSENNLSSVFKQKPLSGIADVDFVDDPEPGIVYNSVVNYVTVMSKTRDLVYFPTPGRYTIELPSTLKNITSVELIQAIIPDKNNITSEPYLLLQIEEFNDNNNMISTDRNLSNAFAILQLAPPNTTGGFIYMDKKIHENTIKYYKEPKASLSKMTISITDSDGNVFNFGDDSAGPLKSLQNLFVFRIVTTEKQRDTVNRRNV